MLVRSKAPLRLGLAGGGTDVAPFSDLYGGAILNGTISMYAHACIEPQHEDTIFFELADKKISRRVPLKEQLLVDNEFKLLSGIYNRLVRDYIHQPVSFKLTTYVDVPAGSGLGTSSTLVVAILGAFTEWLKLPLGEYDIARLAYEIERNDLGMAGGKQDQYSATFGGINFMEFYEDDKVIVNPLRIKDIYLNELSHNLVLYYTETSRISAEIIEAQQKNVREGNTDSIDAMLQLKKQAIMMKEVLLRGNLDEIGQILNYGWNYKKKMADGITNPMMEYLYSIALKNGATGGKISGAGGGGFMFFYCPGNTCYQVAEVLNKEGGQVKRYDFVNNGLTTWIQ